ncbi:hypothetical protein SAMN04487848_0254 [Microbacterium sp. ru370.1]|uniref:SCO7613 C-terminal domain-containing membrane protein n=1 Tax=unclassified Microbacterium TaxID=2609290 RepID=UPI00088055F9|nr:MULTISPECIES: hypothetical protein [unclassified Microbacterium]SDO29794.1 hypothetical protein SAMN04487848_0254 [Microbacterium sp. ru370.1]SIT75752.1 hypothetical protein SAMN05880579_0250 [Microbacterium sp. RU1D]
MTDVTSGTPRAGMAWPAQPGVLTDTTRCPSCFTTISTTPCTACGLDLTDVRTARVLELSRRIVELSDQRADVLLRIRQDAAAAAAGSHGDVVAPASSPATVPAATPAWAAPSPARVTDGAPLAVAEGPGVLAPPASGAATPASTGASSSKDAVEPGAGAPGPAAQDALAPGAVVQDAVAPAAVVQDAVPPGAAAPPTKATAPVGPGTLNPAAPPADPSPSVDPPAPVVPISSAGPVPSGGSVPPSGTAAPEGVATDPAKPRRSGVQVFLLSAGVVLLAVAAAFFLTVAWVAGGLVLRSVVVAVATAGVVVTASLLRRRGLTATAEGIALLGIALIALDVWAVRANDLAGAAAVGARVYWGVAALIAGVAFVGWARQSRLRSPLSVGAIALVLGPASVAAGIAGDDAAVAWYAAAVTTLAVALAAPLLPRLARPDAGSLRVETAVIRGLAAIGAVVGLAAALVRDPGATWAPVAATLPLALLVAAHAAIAARRDESATARVAAPLAVVLLGAGVAATAIRSTDPAAAVTVPLLVATVVALGLDLSRSRARAGSGRTALSAAALAAGVAAGLAALPPLGWALFAWVAPIVGIGRVFARSASEVDVPDATSSASVLSLAAVVVLAAIAWRWGSPGAARRPALLWAGAVVALLAGPQLRMIGAVVLWNLALAVVATWLLLRRRGPVAVAATGGLVAAVAGWVLSFSSPLTWAVATVVVAALLWTVAPAARATRVPAVVAFTLFVPLSAVLVPSVVQSGLNVRLDEPHPLTAGAAVAAVLLALAVLPSRSATRLTVAQREAMVLTGLLLVVALGLPALVWARGGLAATVWLVAVGIMTVVSAAAIVMRRALVDATVVRPVAALLVPIIAAATVLTGVREAEPTPFARSVLLASVGVVCAAVALWRLRADRLTRGLFDAGAVVVGLAAVVSAIFTAGVAMPLLLLAVVVLIQAVDADGLFASRGSRRHLVWLALALAAVALWTQLTAGRVEAVEAFTLPVAAALLAIATAEERARRRVATRPASAPAVIAFAGVALAVLPTAASAGDEPVRAVVSIAVGAALAVAGAWVRPPRTPEPLPLAVATAGALGLVVALGACLIEASARGVATGGVLDATVVVVTAALLATAAGIARREPAWSRTVAGGVVAAGVVVFTLGEAVLIGIAEGPVARATMATLLLGAAGAAVLRSGALTRVVPGADPAVTGFAALGGTALLAVVGIGAGVRPLEALTVPLALALLAAAVPGRARPVTAQGGVLVAAGLAVGLLPSAVLVSDDLGRTIVVLIISGVLTAVSALRSPSRLAPLVPTVFGVSAAALVLAGVIRSFADLDRPIFDLWVPLVMLPLSVAAVLRRHAKTPPVWLAAVSASVALAVFALTTIARIVVTPDEGTIRAAITVAVVAGVGAAWRGVGERTLAAVGLGLGFVVAVSGAAFGVVDPIESVTVPLAVGALVVGGRALRRRETLRSWPALGAPLALLLVPSLLFDFGGGNALWRIVALGVVALAALLLGVRFRLQAPVLLGGVVLIVHAVAQLWPWIASIYESVSGLWWLWIGVAGALLVTVAATYERRLREVKAVGLAIRALR